MTDLWGLAASAFALGFALGAAPGPVQVLILSETAKRGLAGGLRVMLGANLTLLVILVVLALGFSSLQLGPGVLRALRIVGGGFLIVLGATELRAIARPEPAEADDVTRRAAAYGPTLKGIVSVLLNPGAWIFFATTASAVIANATHEGGTADAVLAVVAMAVGVSCSDATFTVLGSGGRRLFGDRGLRAIRIGLAALLVLIGLAFVVQGVRGG